MSLSKQAARGDAGSGGLLVGLSNELAAVMARAGQFVVRVNARRRIAGSGIVWSADGLVVTADHVVEVEEGITVGLPDGRAVAAQLVGRDAGSDLALLRLQVTGLAPAEISGGGEVKVGNLVLALGRPTESGVMATLGMVSAISGPWRTWRGGLLESLIQSDLTLYPGFSGGPLVDATGRVAGLNSSILARGVSVAVPVDTVQRVAQALLSEGRVRRGYLGVSTQPAPLPAGLAARLGLRQESGLLVVRVEPGSPADQGGVMLGDVLVAVAGQPVQDVDELQALLGAERVGTATPLVVIRGGERRALTVTVGERGW